MRTAPAALVIVTACSFGIHSVSPQPKSIDLAGCVESRVVPALDTTAAVTLGVLGVLLAAASSDRTTDPPTGAGIAVIGSVTAFLIALPAAAGAVHGFNATGACREGRARLRQQETATAATGASTAGRAEVRELADEAALVLRAKDCAGARDAISDLAPLDRELAEMLTEDAKAVGCGSGPYCLVDADGTQACWQSEPECEQAIEVLAIPVVGRCAPAR